MELWIPLRLSLSVSVAGLIVALLVGVPLAAALALGRWRGRDLVEVLLTAPMVLPPTVLGYYLLVAFGRDGAPGRLYEALFGTPLVFTPAGCVLAATVAALPFVVKSTRAALEEVDHGLLAAAATLGAGPWRRAVTILLPLARRGIAAGAMLGFARALGDFGVTLMVAGSIPGLTRTAPLAIYDALLAGQDALAGGLAALLAAVGIAVLLLVNRAVPPARGRRTVT